MAYSAVPAHDYTSDSDDDHLLQLRQLDLASPPLSPLLSASSSPSSSSHRPHPLSKPHSDTAPDDAMLTIDSAEEWLTDVARHSIVQALRPIRWLAFCSSSSSSSSSSSTACRPLLCVALVLMLLLVTVVMVMVSGWWSPLPSVSSVSSFFSSSSSSSSSNSPSPSSLSSSSSSSSSTSSSGCLSTACLFGAPMSDEVLMASYKVPSLALVEAEMATMSCKQNTSRALRAAVRSSHLPLNSSGVGCVATSWSGGDGLGARLYRMVNAHVQAADLGCRYVIPELAIADNPSAHWGTVADDAVSGAHAHAHARTTRSYYCHSSTAEYSWSATLQYTNRSGWVSQLRCWWLPFRLNDERTTILQRFTSEQAAVCPLDAVCTPTDDSNNVTHSPPQCAHHSELMLIAHPNEITNYVAGRRESIAPSVIASVVEQWHAWLPPLDRHSTCRYPPHDSNDDDVVVLAIHIRGGDAPIVGGFVEQMELALWMINSLSMVSAGVEGGEGVEGVEGGDERVGQVRVEVHVFSEPAAASPCPTDGSFSQFPHTLFTSDCQQLPASSECVHTAVLNATECPPAHTPLLQGVYVGKDGRSTVPLVLHAHSAPIDDLQCMADADILVTECSDFSILAAFLALRSIKIIKPCGHPSRFFQWFYGLERTQGDVWITHPQHNNVTQQHFAAAVRSLRRARRNTHHTTTTTNTTTGAEE